MRIGFTGTRESMTERQCREVETLLRSLNAAELHHGDCRGADAQAHTIAEVMEMRTVSHPPIDDRMRAHCLADETRDPREYLARNKDIVDDTDVLIACPDGPERQRSGTWSTVRYALRKKRYTIVVMPEGGTTVHNRPLRRRRM